MDIASVRSDIDPFVDHLAFVLLFERAARDGSVEIESALGRIFVGRFLRLLQQFFELFFPNFGAVQMIIETLCEYLRPARRLAFQLMRGGGQIVY